MALLLPAAGVAGVAAAGEALTGPAAAGAGVGWSSRCCGHKSAEEERVAHAKRLERDGLARVLANTLPATDAARPLAALMAVKRARREYESP